jgi:hypothetical protein
MSYHLTLITPVDSVPIAIRRKLELTTLYWGAFSDCNKSLAFFAMS